MRAERGLSSSFLRQFRSQIVFSTTLQTIKQWSPSVLCVWLRLCSGKWKPTVLCVVIIQQTFAKIHLCVYGIVKFPEETIKLLHFSLNCSLMRNILENFMTHWHEEVRRLLRWIYSLSFTQFSFLCGTPESRYMISALCWYWVHGLVLYRNEFLENTIDICQKTHWLQYCTLKKWCYIALKVVLWLVIIGEPLLVLYSTKSWCFSGSSVVLHQLFGITEGLYCTAIIYRTC